MDKNKLAALAIVIVAIVCGVYLTAKGIPVPSWLASLLAVLTPVGAGFALYATPPSSDKPKPPPLPLILLVLVLPVLACSWLSRPSHYADAAKILACISAEAAAGKGAADIALTCGLENADAVIDLVTKSQGVASAAPKMAKPAASASVKP